MKIVLSKFVRRQTKSSRFSHWECSDTVLVDRVTSNFHQGKPGLRPGVFLIPIAPDQIYSAIVRLKEGDMFIGSYAPRKEGEHPRKAFSVVGGKKLPARSVEAVLYSRGILAENNENFDKTADFEIVSINASPDDDIDMPMEVGTLLANYFHEDGSNDGGTKIDLSPEQLVAELRRSYLFWRDKGFVSDPCGMIVSDEIILRKIKEEARHQPAKFARVLHVYENSRKRGYDELESYGHARASEAFTSS